MANLVPSLTLEKINQDDKQDDIHDSRNCLIKEEFHHKAMKP